MAAQPGKADAGSSWRVTSGEPVPCPQPLVQESQAQPAGALLAIRHFPWSAEIYLMAVDPGMHRRGAGRALVLALEADLIDDGAEYLQVKTLGPAQPDAGYGRTRQFYTGMGFRPLEETTRIWPQSPCLIMVKALTSSPAGKTDYIQADLRDAGTILAEAARTLDFSQPIAILLIGVLHFIPDAEDPYAILRRVVDGVPSGSYLVIGHGASDIEPAAAAELTRRYNEASPVKIRLRSRAEVVPFFGGLELVGRGLVPLSQWWDPGRVGTDTASGLAGHVGIARKP